MNNVAFKTENITKCICPRCLVQINSHCSKDKMKKASDAKAPKPKDVPQLYCSSGKAVCKDLDMKQMCICGSCPIWAQYKLMKGKPSMYFCRDGKAR